MPTLPQNMLLCPKLSKGPYNVTSKSVFSSNSLVEEGQMMTKADQGGKGGQTNAGLKTPEIG